MMRIIIWFLIKHADAELIEMVLDAVYKRKEELFPEWEIMYVALPRKDREKRLRYLAWMYRTELEHTKV